MSGPRTAGSATPPLIVSAYTAAPSIAGGNRRDESRFLAAIADLPAVGGIELPFGEGLRPFDEEWITRRGPGRFGVVITSIPDTVHRAVVDPRFGLASHDREGRAHAVSRVRAIRDAVSRLVDDAGRQVVLAVQVHTAPRRWSGYFDAGALIRSVAELASWDWNGAVLAIEHCDSPTDPRHAVKGFAPLRDELVALGRVVGAGGCRAGASINWGRSAVEGRSVATPVEHIELARTSGLLVGVTFSGTSAVATASGDAWDDGHPPPAPPPTGRFDRLEPRSLLTPTALRAAFAAIGGARPVFIGVKVSAPAGADTDDRIAVVTQSVAVIDESAASAVARTCEDFCSR
ncbi:DUF4862 family protein [Rhodococcus zopfii]